MQCWFVEISLFRGTIHVTSQFLYSVIQMSCHYLYFIVSINAGIRLICSDKKTMNEIDRYDTVRRDIVTGEILCHEMEENSTIATTN